MLAGPCLARTGWRRGLSYQAGAPDRAILTGRPDRLDGAVDRAEVDLASRQAILHREPCGCRRQYQHEQRRVGSAGRLAQA
jgi:hypothetical protein